MNRADASASPWLTTPRAILIGSVIVGLFAYAGLRERTPSDTAAVSGSGASALDLSASGPSVVDPTTGTGSTRTLNDAAAPATAASATAIERPTPDALRADVQRALAPHLPALREKCWTERPPEARVTLTLNVSFDAQGQQLTRGISTPKLPGEQRAWTLGLGNCVQLGLPNLSIPPPGVAVQVDVPVEFP